LKIILDLKQVTQIKVEVCVSTFDLQPSASYLLLIAESNLIRDYNLGYEFRFHFCFFPFGYSNRPVATCQLPATF